MLKRIFITGTDTEIGKTYTTCQLLRYYQRQGYSAIGGKPLASGTKLTAAGFRNDDALALQASSSIVLDYEVVNPIALCPPIAPHLAAQDLGTELSVATLKRACEVLFACNAQVTLIEGVGGWCVPLNNRETMADLVEALGLEVIVVIGMRLGCLNHALLTIRAIEATKLKILGWIANSPEVLMPHYQQNLNTLKHMLTPPCLGQIYPSGRLCVEESGLI